MQPRGEDTFTSTDPFTMHPLETSSTRPADTPLHLNSARDPMRLTTLLGDFTPSRANFSEGFDPDNASAVPSPLYAHPDQQTRSRDRLPEPAEFSTHYNQPGHPTRLAMRQQAGQPMPKVNLDGENKASANVAGVFPDGTSVLQHFDKTNEHLEDQVRRLAILMEKHEGEVMEAVGARHAETVALIKQYAQENKAHFISLEELVKHISSEGVAVTQKIRDLMAFIRKDVFETVSVQNKRTAALENEVKQLTRIVYDLHNAFLDKAAKPRSPTKPSKAPALPSQPTAAAQWTDKLKSEGVAAQKSADRDKPHDGRAPPVFHARGKSYGEASNSGNMKAGSNAPLGPPATGTGQARNVYKEFRSRSRSPTKSGFGQDGPSK
jgi:hypothetical protein